MGIFHRNAIYEGALHSLIHLILALLIVRVFGEVSLNHKTFDYRSSPQAQTHCSDVAHPNLFVSYGFLPLTQK